MGHAKTVSRPAIAGASCERAGGLASDQCNFTGIGSAWPQVIATGEPRVYPSVTAPKHPIEVAVPAPVAQSPEVALVPIAYWFRAACQRELSHALSLLADPHGDRNMAVHEGRKSLRRVRAWLRLLDRDRRQQLQPMDLALRATRRTIGPLRDAASRIEALDRLRKRRDMGAERTPLTRARQGLAADLTLRWQRRPLTGNSWKKLLTSLSELADGVAHWPLEGITEAELRRGIKRAFVRACAGRRECAGRIGAVRRHAWRGRVRILLLQGQLLQAHGEFPGLSEFKRLAQGLGNENDLALVGRVLGRLSLPERTRAAVRTLARQQRLALIKRNDQRAALLLRSKLAPRWRLQV